jgi:hypothetical protein
VPGRREEVRAIATNRLVFGRRQLDDRRAVLPWALAEERNPLDRIVELDQLLADLLVGLAEDRVVARNALLLAELHCENL